MVPAQCRGRCCGALWTVVPFAACPRDFLLCGGSAPWDKSLEGFHFFPSFFAFFCMSGQILYRSDPYSRTAQPGPAALLPV